MNVCLSDVSCRRLQEDMLNSTCMFKVCSCTYRSSSLIHAHNVQLLQGGCRGQLSRNQN